MKSNLSHNETLCGWVYLCFQLLFLPSILVSLNGMLSHRLSDAELNFAFFFINFLAVSWIFHHFLGESFQQVLRHPVLVMQAVILGAVAYFACSQAVEWVIGLLLPGYTNANDATIASLAGSSRFLMTLGTVVLVPPVEECLHRGLIFRKLYGKNKWAGYIVSILVFAFIHIVGYIGTYSPLELCMAVLQYLPAGLCLAWTYTKADTIFAPMAVHALVNAVAIGSL